MLLSPQEACDHSAEHGKSKAVLPFVPWSVCLSVCLTAAGHPASPGGDTHGMQHAAGETANFRHSLSSQKVCSLNMAQQTKQ